MGRFSVMPRLLFCATKRCSKKFGNPQIGAQYFWGTNQIVVSDVGWVKYMVRHEMIHHWQAEQFGAAESAKNLPQWYVEGMAYEFSNDPRGTISSPVAQKHRARFRAWIAAGNNWRVPPA